VPGSSTSTTTEPQTPTTKRLRRALAAWLVVGLLLLVVAVFAVRKALLLSADPVADKRCPPLIPASTDPGRPGRTEIAGLVGLAWAQRGGTLDDASCLDSTPVYGVVQVRDVEDVRRALRFARDNDLTVSVAGVKHSMGGQALARHGIVLDMTRFNRMSLDAAARVLTVQSGATWHDIQNLLHPRFAVKAMQSTDIFTVGGSISVNAHGMDHRVGAIGRTVRAMRVMLADGAVHTVSRTEHPELFRLVVGGYGLFGVILDVDLDVTDNAVYRSERRIVAARDFPALFEKDLAPDGRVALMYAHLSTSPASFLDETLVYGYRAVEARGVAIPPLGEVRAVRLRRLVFTLSKYGGIALRLKWLAEKYVEPRLESCPVTRNQALGEGEACLVPRNQPMHDSVKYLKNDLVAETDILQEYYVPRPRFVEFIDGLRRTLTDSRANLLNASVRVVHREDNLLTYAPADMFAVVLYLNQTTDAAGNARMGRLTRELIDLTTGLGGTFFLPYQLHYTPEQLERSYPMIREFFASKRRYDPAGLLTNVWYAKYAPALGG